jgi:hypothetical protein
MRYLCLLAGEPDMDGPVPGTPEFMQMLSGYQSATALALDPPPAEREFLVRRLSETGR